MSTMLTVEKANAAVVANNRTVNATDDCAEVNSQIYHAVGSVFERTLALDSAYSNELPLAPRTILAASSNKAARALGVYTHRL